MIRPPKVVTTLAAIALLAAPAFAAAQTAAGDPHHPEQGAGSEPGSAPSGADPAGEGPAAAGAAPAAGGQQMMGSQMMGPDMMRMMNGMMQGMAQPGLGDGPTVILMVPVPMMEGGMMPGGMTEGGMMGGMMSGDMIRPDAGGVQNRMAGIMQPGSGLAALTAGVVLPARHLSAEDVSHHLEHRLKQAGNPRLQIGDVSETDVDTVTAEIVTTDGSLVERLQVDRHSGVIERMP